MIFANGETVVVVHPTTGATDDYGNPIDDWANATRITVENCGLAPRTEPESGSPDAPAAIIGFTLYAPPGTSIATIDRIEARGVTWEVDGIPGEWRNPFTGTDFGLEVALRRSESA